MRRTVRVYDHKYEPDRRDKMPLTGVNKLCAQCIKECKQWPQVDIIRCPFFKSKYHRSTKAKDGHTLRLEQNQLEAHREAIIGT